MDKENNLDRLFSQLVRLKAEGICGVCGKQKADVDCAHIIPRRYRVTRWLEDNAVCLCRGCHMYYTAHPHDWAEITKDWLGGKLQEIRVLAHSGRPPKDPDKIILGSELIEKIKAMGEKPVCGLGKLGKKSPSRC